MRYSCADMEEPSTPPWYVLTGGPCAGKTTTIDEIAGRGYFVLPEPARLVINEQLARGKTIEEIVSDSNWLPSVVERAAAQERKLQKSETWFLDRATPDSLAYYRKSGRAVEPFFEEALRTIRYRKVFLLDLVDFMNDEGRPETVEEAKELHSLIRDAYASQGYEIVSVPVMPVAERVEYIFERL
jgi:predicted ATPase